MRDLILRFPHLAEKIFQQLDNEGLARSRQVEKLWQKFIDERNYPWLRIVDIPTILQDGDTYLHLAAQSGQMDMFEIILDEEKDKDPKSDVGETPFLTACSKGRMNVAFTYIYKKGDELEIDLNTKDHKKQTAFHLACLHGHSEIAEMIAKNSSNTFTTTATTKLKIGLNNKNIDGSSAFHLACWQGHSEIAEMIMKNSSKLNIDLNSKNNTRDGNPGAYNLRSISDGWTAFHFTCFSGHSEIAEMIMKNSSQLKMDLNRKDNYGMTAFHFACMRGHIKIVNMMIEQSESLELDLEAKDNEINWATFMPYGAALDEVSRNMYISKYVDNKTGYQLAKVFERNDIVNLIQMKMPSLALYGLTKIEIDYHISIFGTVPPPFLK